MTGKSFKFQGIEIICDDHLPKDRMFMISQDAAKAIEEAQGKLGRQLTADEVISCMIHKNCVAVLECAEQDKPRKSP